MRYGIVLACALAQLISLTARADDMVIEHVTLIDGIHAPQSDMTVAIDGDRITAVTPARSHADLRVVALPAMANT
jgi:hypothetical protein